MDPRRLVAIGTGVGIEVRTGSLEVTLIRVRPGGIHLVGSRSIGGYLERPAAEIGAEYRDFLKGHGYGHLSAAVLLPRREVIVRQLSLPGVAARDLSGAIDLQVDSLHPYGEDPVSYSWRRLGGGNVLFGLVRSSTLDRHRTFFAEAGIAVAAFSFSSAVLYAALRFLATPPPEGLLAAWNNDGEGIEVYGESPARPVFSAEFDLPVERALELAASELRLGPEVRPGVIQDHVPAALNAPSDLEFSRSVLPYSAALVGACPWLAPTVNLLPAPLRATGSRVVYLPTLVLAGLLLLGCCALLVYPRWKDRVYLNGLEAEIHKLEPEARSSASLDRQIELARGRIRLLDEFRGRSKADLEALNELTRLLTPPIWTNQVDLTRDSATISGEADQAAPMLKTIDESPIFAGSEFSVPIARSGSSELFRIRSAREGKR